MADAPKPIVLTLVTGPRGSGKSRLINATRAACTTPTLAFANETGNTSLTGAIVAVPDQTTNGCLCCRAGAFAGLLEQILRDIDNGRQINPEQLFFETSGTADPMLLLSECIAHPYLGRRFTTGSVVMPLTMPPPETLPDDMKRQIEGCSVLVGVVAPWRSIIEHLNPNAAMTASMDAAAVLETHRFEIAQRNESARRRLYAGSRRPMARKL